MTTIYFDMDGTLANLYGIENWLPKLLASDPTPYAEAEPLLDMGALTEELARLQSKGHKIGIVSWLCKGANKEYDKAVRLAKREWLAENIGIEFDEMHIVKYGTPKHYIIKDKNGILFDDETKNRNTWKGTAYDEKNILATLKAIA